MAMAVLTLVLMVDWFGDADLWAFGTGLSDLGGTTTGGCFVEQRQEAALEVLSPYCASSSVFPPDY